MDTFSYVNIFATKGIEYLLVIGFLLVLFAFVRYLAKPAPVQAVREAELLRHKGQLGVLPDLLPLRPRPGAFVASGHTCNRLREDGCLEVSLGALVHHLLGEIERVEVVAPQQVRAGDVLAVLHQDGRRLHVRAPVDGIVTEVHTELVSGSEKLIFDPEHAQWLVRLRPLKITDALARMHYADEARHWLDGELQRLRDLLASNAAAWVGAPLALADGGTPVRGLAGRMPVEHWQQLERSFFGGQT
ncbi:MAG: hypothetical protein ABIJ09_13695 [Pseudomonadota bacterium]